MYWKYLHSKGTAQIFRPSSCNFLIPENLPWRTWCSQFRCRHSTKCLQHPTAVALVTTPLHHSRGPESSVFLRLSVSETGVQFHRSEIWYSLKGAGEKFLSFILPGRRPSPRLLLLMKDSNAPCLWHEICLVLRWATCSNLSHRSCRQHKPFPQYHPTKVIRRYLKKHTQLTDLRKLYVQNWYYHCDLVATGGWGASDEPPCPWNCPLVEQLAWVSFLGSRLEQKRSQ